MGKYHDNKWLNALRDLLRAGSNQVKNGEVVICFCIDNTRKNAYNVYVLLKDFREHLLWNI